MMRQETGPLLQIILIPGQNYLAKLLERHKWIGYLGLAIIAYVAGDMIWRGSMEIQARVLSSLSVPCASPECGFGAFGFLFG